MAGQRLLVAAPTLQMTLHTESNLNDLQDVEVLLLLIVQLILTCGTAACCCRAETRNICDPVLEQMCQK